MSKMPAKKVTPSKGASSPSQKPTSNAAKPPQKVSTAKTTNEPLAIAVDKPETKIVKMKQVVPKEMEKLENLKKWPIILDEVGM